MPELCVLPSPFLSAASLSLCPSLSPPFLSGCLSLLSLAPPVSLSLCLYLFAISLCASPRRVLTANNAPRDALENIHFSCRGEAREPRVAFEIYFPLKLPMHRTPSLSLSPGNQARHRRRTCPTFRQQPPRRVRPATYSPAPGLDRELFQRWHTVVGGAPLLAAFVARYLIPSATRDTTNHPEELPA